MKRFFTPQRIFNITLLLLMFAASAYSQDINKKTAEQKTPLIETKDGDLDAEQIIEQNKDALVSVWFHTDNYSSFYYSSLPKDTTILSGSGFIFDSRGFLGTNYHVIDGFDSLLVKTSDGTFYEAELVYVEEKNDIAILRILNGGDKLFPTVKIGNSDLPKVGQSVFAVGSPLGFEYTISEGIIAAIRENEKVSFNDPATYALIEKNFDKVIQITAAISPGNSGGALFNAKGEVIGITTYSYGFYGNLNFAIAINSFTRVASNINFATLENDEIFLEKKKDNLFNSNYRLAESYKSNLYGNWYYTKQHDTMKTYDTMVVKQDSINKIHFNKSEQYYNMCIDMKPDTFYVYQGLMDLYVFTEKFDKAESLYGAIKERFSSDSLLSTFSTSLAQAYSTSKDYKKALMFYEKIYAKDTGDTYILSQIADLYYKQKEIKKSEDIYKKMIKKDANNVNGYVQLGKIYYDKGNYEEAKKYIEDAFEKTFLEEYSYGSYFDLHYYRGLIAVKEDRRMEAMLAYIDLKNTYTYTREESEKKLTLYKAIKKMEE
ncbi:MAG: trypsin-like peptidase domain-containing protein [Candidatus Kapaibacterium sp.]